MTHLNDKMCQVIGHVHICICTLEEDDDTDDDNDDITVMRLTASLR